MKAPPPPHLEDKSVIYRNICHVMRGTLEASFVKNEKTLVRRMQGDHALRDPAGVSQTLPGRAVCLVRNVGHHMFTDAVMSDVGQVPEGFLDCLVTVVCALHDLQGTGGESPTWMWRGLFRGSHCFAGVL